jgi:hypothetical protein
MVLRYSTISIKFDFKDQIFDYLIFEYQINKNWALIMAISICDVDTKNTY